MSDAHTLQHSPHIQSLVDGGAGPEGRGEQPLNSQHCTSPCIQAQAPHHNAAHDLSLNPTVLFKNHLFNYTLFAVAMADAETAPAEPQALSVLYCGGMFNAISFVVPLHMWPPTIRG